MKPADEWINDMKWGHIAETVEGIRDEMREEGVKKIRKLLHTTRHGRFYLESQDVIKAIRNVGKE